MSLRLLLAGLALCAAQIAALPELSLAVVRPPDEWFDSPAKQQLWDRMHPVLNDLEFNAQKPQNANPQESLAGIVRFHLQTSEQVSLALGETADSPAAFAYDLNRDGAVNQFDVLELGYRVQPSVKRASIAPPTGTNKVVLLRADFQDQNANYGTYDINYFNDRFFTDGTSAKPSFRDYFKEVSYGQLDITGAVPDCGPGGDGWYKGVNNKQWYIDNGGRNLVTEAVLALDAEGFDFSDYDVDADGYVDTVFLFYPNAVFENGLWPHRSSGLNISVDGVIVDSYFITGYNTGADSWTMEISAHEYGHILGLPDLYDVDGGSSGMGRWSLMAYQYDGNHKPPSPDPWCKTKLGWVTPLDITEDVDNYSLGNYQDNPNVLRVWTNGKRESQYFLVANYRQKKTDAPRPGQGLLVLHIDDTRSGGNGDNANEDRKHVDVESARGYYDAGQTNPGDPLDDSSSSNENAADNGHSNDLWRAGNTDPDYTGIFDDTSNPFARNYPNPGSNTFIRLSDISAPGDNMTLDINVRTADAPTVAITAPDADNTISGDSVTISADVTAGSGRTILRTEFYCNGAIVGTDSGAPYSISFDSRSIFNGVRQIKVIAYDDAGDANGATEEIGIATRNVTVNNSGIALPYLDPIEGSISRWAIHDPAGAQRWAYKTNVSGRNCAGINGGTSGYDYNEMDDIVSVRINLAGAAQPLCRWRQRYRVANGENNVQVFITDDDGANWTKLMSKTGQNTTWHAASVDLTDYIGSEVYLIFRLQSSSLNRLNGTTAGFWIDDFEVKELSSTPVVTSITPGNGSTLSGMQTITVSATDDEGIASVDFIMDGTDLLSSDATPPYTFSYNSDWVFNGAHTFTARAWDGDAQSGTASVNWTLDNAGVSLPYTENFSTNPGVAWRVVDTSGSGIWHHRTTGGYGNSHRYYCAISGGTQYSDNEFDWFVSPTYNLTSATDPGFAYLGSYRTEAGWDYCRLFVTTDYATWTQLWQGDGLFATFAPYGYRLDAYIGQRVKIGYLLESDISVTESGWSIDELRFATAPQITSLSPSRIVKGVQTNVTITGTGFGASGAADDFHAAFFGATNLAIVSWSDTSIVATVPASTANNDIKVRRRGVDSDGALLKVILAAPGIVDLGVNP